MLVTATTRSDSAISTVSSRYCANGTRVPARADAKSRQIIIAPTASVASARDVRLSSTSCFDVRFATIVATISSLLYNRMRCWIFIFFDLFSFIFLSFYFLLFYYIFPCFISLRPFAVRSLRLPSPAVACDSLQVTLSPISISLMAARESPVFYFMRVLIGTAQGCPLVYRRFG